MTVVYPAVFTPVDDGYVVYVPDLQINTQGDDLANAIAMARDAIGLVCITREDKRQPLPAPSPLNQVAHDAGDTVSMVDIDLSAYRLANERRAVRRNVSLPAWLNAEAERAGVNVSAVLQNALKQELHITEGP